MMVAKITGWEKKIPEEGKEEALWWNFLKSERAKSLTLW